MNQSPPNTIMVPAVGPRASRLRVASRNETGIASSLLSRKIRTSFVRASRVIDAAALASADHEEFPINIGM